MEKAIAFAEQAHSSALLILHRGRILAERYWPLEARARFAAGAGYGVVGLFEYDESGRPIEDVASIQKSIVAFLVSVARQEGLVALDTSVSHYLGVGWSAAASDAEREITVRHLLAMSSGLTTGLEFDAPAGTTWHYNTSAYSKLLAVLEAASGMTPNEYTRLWLTGRIGMSSAGWRRRAWFQEGMEANHVGFGTGVRDLGRFGLLVAAGGEWNGVRLIRDPTYLEESLRPSQALNPSYGLLWWLNNGTHWEDWDHRGLVQGRLIETAPADMVVARGYGDRRVYVVPSLGLVVVRLGAPAFWRVDDTPDLNTFDHEFWRMLMAAAPG